MLGPVFIVGSPRTGTSAMTAGLRHAGYAGHAEGHFLPLFHVMERAAADWYKRYGKESKPKVLLFEQPISSFMSRYRAFIREYMINVYGGLFWLDKTGGRLMVESLPLLKNVFPEARIVYCHRNPCEVISSRLVKWPGISFEEHCDQLVALMHVWHETKAQLADWIEIDQREMISQPQLVADRMAGHLDLSPDERARFCDFIANHRPQRSSTIYSPLSLSDVDWTNDQKSYFSAAFEEDAFAPQSSPVSWASSAR